MVAGRGWDRCAKEHLREQCEEHEIVEKSSVPWGWSRKKA